MPLLIFMLAASDSGILFTKAGCTPPLPPIPNLHVLFDFELSHVACFGQYNEASIMMCYFQAWAFINPLFPCLAFFASAITKITFLSFCSDARKMRDIYRRTTTDKPSINKLTLRSESIKAYYNVSSKFCAYYTAITNQYIPTSRAYLGGWKACLWTAKNHFLSLKNPVLGSFSFPICRIS